MRAVTNCLDNDEMSMVFDKKTPMAQGNERRISAQIDTGMNSTEETPLPGGPLQLLLESRIGDKRRIGDEEEQRGQQHNVARLNAAILA